ncbi:MAG: DUF2115 family protein [Methanobrevibacter sp.]|nr:DUF2115 family protein [Methanobrevibacter sp.]
MKARDLMEEIRENIKDYDIEIFEKKASDENTDQASKQRAHFHIQNYNEIMALNIGEEDESNIEIDDGLINDIKDELFRFFEGCSPESEEPFKRFITYSCIYLSVIAKRPLHPVGIDMHNGKTVFAEEKDGETVYYCDIKEEQAKIAKDYYTCQYCVCKPSELKENKI